MEISSGKEEGRAVLLQPCQPLGAEWFGVLGSQTPLCPNLPLLLGREGKMLPRKDGDSSRKAVLCDQVALRPRDSTRSHKAGDALPNPSLTSQQAAPTWAANCPVYWTISDLFIIFIF